MSDAIPATPSSSTPPPPPPLDDPTVTDPLSCPALRWGILGCGRVSHDFCQALKLLPSAVVSAAAARSAESSRAFALKHGISTHYADYDGLLTDPSVDIVYVGNIHAFRRDIGERCLKAGKHVLLEKPFACNQEDAAYLIALATERGLFCMEGMWTRFFPAVEMARTLVHEERALGEIVSVHSDFNFNASDSEDYPASFVYDRKLGGGASLLVAPYPIAAATLFFHNDPHQIKVVGQVDQRTGVDLQAAMVLSFPPTPGTAAPATDPSNLTESTPKLPGAGVATLSFGLLGESVEETVVVGTKGRLTLRAPGHCPTELRVTLKGDGRGGSTGDTAYHWPVPAATPEIDRAGGFFYPNSSGFAYEAAAVARCIAKGLTQIPQYDLKDTLKNMKLVDEVRRQLGVKDMRES